MNEKLPHHTPLEDYLLGKLSNIDKDALDAKLAADPQLQEELFLQRDIVHALQEERRFELKSRLNNIEVGAGSGGFNTALGIKVAAGLALAGSIASGLYFYFSEKPTTDYTLPLGQIELVQEMPLASLSIPEKPETVLLNPEAISQPDAAAATPEFSPAGVEKSKAPAKASVAAETGHLQDHEEESPASSPKTKNIQIQKPQVVSSFEDADFVSGAQPAELPVDALARNRQFSTQSIEVSTHEHAKYNFHYQFYESKLFIYGDFKNKPYEILEINHNGTTAYYLFFENNYYDLKGNQQKLTKLRKISNEKLIRELNITRSQKMDTQ